VGHGAGAGLATLAAHALILNLALLGTILHRALVLVPIRHKLIIVVPSVASVTSASSLLRPALLASRRVLIVVIDKLTLVATCARPLNLVLGVLVEPALALIDLVLHEIVDPQTHLDVVLQHHNDHAVESEAQVVLLNREVLQLLLEHAQLPIGLRYDLEGAHTRVVFFRHRRETSAPDVLKVTKQRLYHLLYVVRTLVHMLVGQEPSTLQDDSLIHFFVLFELLELLLDLIKLEVEIVGLLLTQRQLLVDVGLQGIVGRLDLVLSLLVPRMVPINVLFYTLFHQLLFFFLDFFQLRVKRLYRLLQVHLALLQLFQSLICFLTLTLGTFDEYVDVLHDIILGRIGLNNQALLS